MHERRPVEFTSGIFARRIVGTGVALTVLLAVLAPESSAPLNFMQRLLFWALHIGLGLAAAALAAYLLVRWLPGLRDWRLVILSGLVGVVLFAPIAYGLETFFPVTEGPPDTDWADRFAQTSLLATILVEILEMAPSYLAAWALINIGSFSEVLSGVRIRPVEEPSPPAHSEEIEGDNHRTPERPPLATSLPPEPIEETPSNPFLERLPPAIGREIVAVSSDLHYLQVVTRRGQAMVLGALREVENIFGDAGLRVHRSHWVHLDAVMRLSKSSSGWQLEMAGGGRVPVSRRKHSAVVERLGEDFVRMA